MMFNQYPYINVNDLNLDYILSQIKVMMNEVTNFVSINAIKYADPIQWDITRQYEKNTIVIDPVTGTAYISVAPVPAGVALTRPEYWTVVFDLGSFVTRAAQNFTSHWEQDTTLTATFPSNVGDWLVWGDVLYKVISPIVTGNQYVEGSNIEHFTIEELYNEILNEIDLQVLNMRGAIAINEGSSTTATINIPAGYMVWVDGNLYMTLVPITIGDTFVSGTNITSVNVNDFVLDRIDTNIQNMRGAIAINEGSSTTATINIPAGYMVWVDGNLYMTLVPITIGDTFVSGTNITSVNVNDFVLDRIDTNIQNMRGAIAINEGSSTTATINIPAGYMVWVDGNLYMTLVPITIGDTFVSGTNITSVNVNNFVLDRIDTLVSNELAKFNTKGYKMVNKHFLFIGDSFGDSTARGFDCWPEIMAADLGLTATQFDNLCVDGAGIWGSLPQYLFITQLENYAGDRNAVTDIVLGEATNDSYSDDPSDVRYNAPYTNLGAIVNYIKANYPNATFYIGYIGNMFDISNIANSTYASRACFRSLLFEWCAEYGINILHGTEYSLCGNTSWFLSDLAHPNLAGETSIGHAMANAYMSGNANYQYWLYNDFNIENPFTNIGSLSSQVSIQGEQTEIAIKGIAVSVAQNTTINQDFAIVGSAHVWMNDDYEIYHNVRLHNFDGVNEKLLSAQLIFRNNFILCHLQEIDGNGAIVTSWTADAGAYITIDNFNMLMNTDRIV